ncbi:MAG: histidine triad nucleotide-binding protein [Oscillospiraceae bacterium]|jgi:histidine triad (HIT) family protein|nr:histidine triad nucleotide-binding protein [Oscillospiraceae bacterium]
MLSAESGCVFCGVARGEIPARILYEDDEIIAIQDVAPQAPVHALIMPKAHVTGLNQLDALSDATLARLMRVASRLAQELGVRERGYRIVSNCGQDACQSQPHLHIHLLGGRAMGAELA